MKILFQSRVDLYGPRGGDTAQMEHTKAAIEKLDPSIKIDISTETHPKNISDYDIVHLFNLDWIPETYVQARWAKEHNKKVVLSAIHHSETEVRAYEDLAAYDIRKIYNSIFKSQAARDVGKNIYRSFFHPRKIGPTLTQIFKGIRNEQREVLKMSDIVLVQTKIEAEDIKKDFSFDNFKWEKIVNGVDREVFESADPEKFNGFINQKLGVDISDNPIILSVGRVEPRKNQLTIVDAFNSLQKEDKLKDAWLVFIGAMTKHSVEYIDLFNAELKKNHRIVYCGAQPQDMVASAMAHKGVFVNVSWFETTGLVSLEAALAGMQVVATGDRVKEYLGDSASYIAPPHNDAWLRDAILGAVLKPKNLGDIQREIRAQYTWENTAKQTIEVYKSL